MRRCHTALKQVIYYFTITLWLVPVLELILVWQGLEDAPIDSRDLSALDVEQSFVYHMLFVDVLCWLVLLVLIILRFHVSRLLLERRENTATDSRSRLLRCAEWALLRIHEESMGGYFDPLGRYRSLPIRLLKREPHRELALAYPFVHVLIRRARVSHI